LQATYAALPAREEPDRAYTSLSACEAPTSIRAAVNGQDFPPSIQAYPMRNLGKGRCEWAGFFFPPFKRILGQPR